MVHLHQRQKIFIQLRYRPLWLPPRFIKLFQKNVKLYTYLLFGFVFKFSQCVKNTIKHLKGWQITEINQENKDVTRYKAVHMIDNDQYYSKICAGGGGGGGGNAFAE